MLRTISTGLVPVLWAISCGASPLPAYPADETPPTRTAPADPGLGPTAAGESSPPATPSLTEAQVLSVLDLSHPAAFAAAETLALARARQHERSLLANPSLELTREDPDGPESELGWTVSWQLPHLDRRARLAAADSQVEAARASAASVAVSLRLALRRAYAEWALAWSRQGLLERQAEWVEKLAERQARRAEQGESSGLEASRLGAAAVALRSRAAVAGAETEMARATVAAWYGPIPAHARPVLPVLPAPIASALSENGASPSSGAPSVLARQAELVAAELERRALARGVSTPEVSLGWLRQESLEGSAEGAVVGLRWSMPLFDRRQASRAVADARITAARASLDLERRRQTEARLGAATAYADLRGAAERAAAASQGHGRMLAGSAAAFRHGETNLADLLDTQRTVLESELAALELHAAALAAHRRLERFGSLSDGPGETSAGKSPPTIHSRIHPPETRP